MLGSFLRGYAFSVSLFVLIAGCSGCHGGKAGADGGPNLCEPGAVEECFCIEGEGNKTCSDDGSSWSKCGCPDYDTGNSDGDSDTDTELYVTDAGPWDWVENPEGEECGSGCKQITFGEEVRESEWDIWDRYLVYIENKDVETKPFSRTIVVNIESDKYLIIPNVYKEYPWGRQTAKTFHPSIYQNSIFYHSFISGSSPKKDELVNVSLDKQTQKVIWSNKRVEGNDDVWPQGLDTYGSRLVTRGGCGNLEVYTLCLFEPPWTGRGRVLINEYYGGGNSLWINLLVFHDFTSYPINITGYDFDKNEFFEVTNDNKFHQAFPRIYEKRVAYMDFSLGGQSPLESWYKGAIRVKDLDTGKETQITDGSAIAATPDIFGDIVIWQDYRHCSNPQDATEIENTDIYGYNLSTGKEFRITNLPGRRKGDLRIWGNKVFVQMFKANGPGDAIYMFDLPEEAR